MAILETEGWADPLIRANIKRGIILSCMSLNTNCVLNENWCNNAIWPSGNLSQTGKGLLFINAGINTDNILSSVSVNTNCILT